MMNTSTGKDSLEIHKHLSELVKQNGSDLYITAGARVSARIRGSVIPLYDGNDEALPSSKTRELVLSCMSQSMRDDFNENKNLNFSIELQGYGRFRISAFQQRCHLGIVARHIDDKLPTLDGLGMPAIFHRTVMQKRGLILMVGPTGSGKSTTLAAMINHRNQNEAGHIITMEDPIEFVHEHKKGIVTQREVGTDTPNFYSGLKAALRQDPDAILLGEIRDKELMHYGLEFSNTGHLCLATLHANNAPQAIERAIHLFPPDERENARRSIAENLHAVFSQRLIKNKDGKVIAILEVLINTLRISDLIVKGEISEIHEAMAGGGKYDMQTFDQHLTLLCKQGIITGDAAVSNADSPNDVRISIRSSDPARLSNIRLAD